MNSHTPLTSSLPVGSADSKRYLPPTRASISKTETLQTSLFHHCICWTASVKARNTRSGGAAISISLTIASRSGVMMAVGICAPRCLVLLAARRFFRVFGLHKSFQAGQIGAPKNAVLFQPGVNSFQRLWIQRVKAMAAFPSLLDQMRAPQQAEMLRDCRTGNRKCAGDLAGGLTPAAKQLEDGAPRGIGESLKSCFGGICNRTGTQNSELNGYGSEVVKGILRFGQSHLGKCPGLPHLEC